MKYRKLGNTGLIVSEVALGSMQFGGKMNRGNLGQEQTTQIMKLALDRGINFIDTADVQKTRVRECCTLKNTGQTDAGRTCAAAGGPAES